MYYVIHVRPYTPHPLGVINLYPLNPHAQDRIKPNRSFKFSSMSHSIKIQPTNKIEPNK